MPNLGERSSAEIGEIIDNKEKELQEAIKDQAKVEQEILLLRRDVIDLQRKRTDLEIAKSKATENVRLFQSELRVLRVDFWAAKNSGR